MKKISMKTVSLLKADVLDKVCDLQKQVEAQLKAIDVSKAYAFLQIPTVAEVKRLEQKVTRLEKQLKAKRSKAA